MSYEAAIALAGGDEATLAESLIISLEDAMAHIDSDGGPPDNWDKDHGAPSHQTQDMTFDQRLNQYSQMGGSTG
jgi:hypothetical protein